MAPSGIAAQHRHVHAEVSDHEQAARSIWRWHCKPPARRRTWAADWRDRIFRRADLPSRPSRSLHCVAPWNGCRKIAGGLSFFGFEEGRSFEEIGLLTDRTPAAARKAWSRAMERLRQEWEGES